jgi:hypothetical protein
MKRETRNDIITSEQISKMGYITNVSSDDFTIENENIFLIKNEGDEPVSLDVVLSGDRNTVINVLFYPGWNPELVRVIKQTSANVSNLKWGN